MTGVIDYVADLKAIASLTTQPQRLDRRREQALGVLSQPDQQVAGMRREHLKGTIALGTAEDPARPLMAAGAGVNPDLPSLGRSSG